MATITVENNARTRGRPFQTGQPNPGFKPGQSGNPGGRPKGLANLAREMFGNDGGEKMLQMMWDIACDEQAPRRDRMQAIAWCADRGWGKAPDVVFEESDAGRYPMLDLDKLSTDQLNTLLELYEAAQPDETSG